MICYSCGEEKLSKEFPQEHLTEECAEVHPLLHCLRCVTASVRDHQKCSQCDSRVTEHNMQYTQYVQALEFLFPPIGAGDDSKTVRQSHDVASKSHLFITTLSEECHIVDYDPNQTITDLKFIVEQNLKTPRNEQRLWYNDLELKETGKHKRLLKLKDYDVQPNSTIYSTCHSSGKEDSTSVTFTALNKMKG
ncbi:uncharacterized protein LOC114520277 [Dendronephthya gigantea]|uniref:uncharacterized protein LOC114520277 n=1 Tax=Dendronephthya gigantea TaxID=151771 RepID=UPI00106B89FB|nr:uncharacterized protein LOC114520277 [Dendronephthya gigantea]